MKKYFDNDYKFFLKVRAGRTGNNDRVPLYVLMNCLFEKAGSPMSFKKDDDFRKECQSNNGIIIVTDRTLWQDIIKKIKEKQENLIFQNHIIEKIEEKRGETTVTKTYKSFYKKEGERLKVILEKMNNFLREFDQNVKIKYSFLNNSSIWIRLVIKDGNDDDQKIEDAEKDLEYFKNIGLYNYDSAKESLEYNIRLQNVNYLDSRGQGHGVHVTPVLYGDEVESLDILKRNHVPF